MITRLKYFGLIGLCGAALAFTSCLGSSNNRSRPSSYQMAREQGVAQDTIQSLRETVQRNPQDINARLSLAAALQDHRELEEAEQELRRALQISPGNALAHNFIGDLYLEWGKKAVQSDAPLAEKKLFSAVEQFEKSIQLAPEPNVLIAALLGKGATYDELGKIYRQHNNSEKAVAVEEKAQSAFKQLIQVCPRCKQQLKAVAIEKAWPRSDFSSAYRDFHLVSFEARIKRVRDEISKIRP